ncbi:hypothetical protein [uncultured Tateyamaria sp.]|uniref:hypothetical protein n=1 Tax=uncultured Tateyamaria sp. TaxID=455651 RepID=UPI002615907B|nr:hypothetical protein [uncultured Tateyamaria sp.]
MSKASTTNRLQTWGLKATWTYLILLFGGIPAAIVVGLIEISPISLNELGDFLAGAFGPLALFWLVLGFIQQGKELQNSVEALNLQAKELAASVAQQADMVSVTRETLKHEKELLDLSEKRRLEALQPKFIVAFRASSKSGNSLTFNLKILNSGAVATDVKFTLSDGKNWKTDRQSDVLQRGESAAYDIIQSDVEGLPTKAYKLLIEYTNQDRQRCETRFDLLPPFPSDNSWSKFFEAVECSGDHK